MMVARTGNDRNAMRLILNVTNSKHPLSHREERVEFDHRGGSIGRALDNACVLPDPERFISSQHALIQFRDNAYLLTDTSVNGVYINESGQPVGKDNTVRLQHGDFLTMGDYELRVTIEPEAGSEGGGMQSSASPWGEPGLRGNAPSIFDGNEQPAASPGFADWDKDVSDKQPSRRPATEPDHVPVEQGHFAPPSMRMAGEEPDWDQTNFTSPPEHVARVAPADEHVGQDISAVTEESDAPDWDHTTFTPAPEPQENRLPVSDDGKLAKNQESSAPASNREGLPETGYPHGNFGHIPETPGPDVAAAPRASVRDAVTTQPGGDEAVRIFLQAAGLNGAQLPPGSAPALLKLFGALYRDIVQGLMEVLRARSDLKNEFRMRHTQISAKENNPLKFSGQVDEALKHLVFNRGTGFLSPEAAFQEAFQDIKDHQVAMVVGMRAAFDSLLRRFDPEQLEQRVTRGKKIGNLLPVNRKANCWERYEEWYAEVSAAADDDFQGLFGDEFTRAYEEQVARLSLLRKKPGG
jgi:type VI secretion system protein